MVDYGSRDPGRVLDELMISFQGMKTVKVEYIDVSEIMSVIHKLTFDDVKKMIIYHKDDYSQDVFNIQLPRIDEAVFLGDEMGDCLPPSGYFTKLQPKVIQAGFGLLTVEINAFESHINFSDNRYLKDQLIFSEGANFIYDYEEEKYVQVQEKELNTTRFNIEKKGLQINQIKDPVVQEFLIREQKLSESLGVLKSLALKKQKQIFDLSKLSVAAGSKYSAQKFLVPWRKFLRESDIWIYLKFFYSQINWNEVQLLRKKCKDFLRRIDRSFELLGDLQENIVMDSFDEDYWMYKHISELNSELRQSLYRRGTGSTGYFRIGNEPGVYEIVENFREIENRNVLAKDKYTDDEIEKEKQRILSRWNQEGD